LASGATWAEDGCNNYFGDNSYWNDGRHTAYHGPSIQMEPVTWGDDDGGGPDNCRSRGNKAHHWYKGCNALGNNKQIATSPNSIKRFF
jgi:hypothetical protein